MMTAIQMDALIDGMSVEDARNLIAELQGYVADKDKLTPDGIRAMLENLDADNSIDGVADALGELCYRVKEAISEYVTTRCNDEAFEAHENGDFDDAIHEAAMEVLDRDNLEWNYMNL